MALLRMLAAIGAKTALACAWLLLLPGYPLAAWTLGEASGRLERCALGTLLSFVLLPYAAFAAGSLGLPFGMMPLLPSLALPFYLRKSLRWSPGTEKNWAAPVGALALCWAAVSAQLLCFETPWVARAGEGTFIYSAEPDHLQHLGLIAEIGRAFPIRTNPFLGGMPPQPYHYFSDFFTALLARTTGLDPWTSYFYSGCSAVAFLVCLALFLLLRSEGAPPGIAAGTLFLSFLLPTWPFASILRRVNGREMLELVALNRPCLSGLVGALVFAVLLGSIGRKPDAKKIALAGLVLGSLFWWKSQYWILCSLAAALACALPGAAGQRRALFSTLAAAGVFSLPLIAKTAAGGLGAGVGWRYASAANYLLDHGDFKGSGALEWLRARGGAPGLFVLTAISLLYLLKLGNICFPLLARALRAKEENLFGLWFAGLLSAAFLVYLGVGPSLGPPWNVANHEQMLLLLAAYAYAGSRAYKALAGRPAGRALARAGIFLVAAWSLSHPRLMLAAAWRGALGPLSPAELVSLSDGRAAAAANIGDCARNAWSSLPISRAEIDALNFIRDRAPADALLVHPYCPESLYTLACAAASRRVALEREFLWDGEQGRYPGAPLRGARVRELYTTSDPSQAARLMEELSAGPLLVLEAKSAPLRFPKGGVLRPLYENSRMRLYERPPRMN